MAITTTPWNSAEHLKTEEDIQLYLEACLDEAGCNSEDLIHALNVIARAKNLGQIDKDSGLINDALYQRHGVSLLWGCTNLAKHHP